MYNVDTEYTFGTVMVLGYMDKLIHCLIGTTGDGYPTGENVSV